MTALVALVALLPLIGAVAVAARCDTRGIAAATIAGAVGSLAAAVVLGIEIVDHGRLQALGGFVYVDPLSAFFATTVSLVVVLAALGSAAYLQAEEDRGDLSRFQVRLYFVFFS